MLVEQVTHMVRWSESITWMNAQGVDTLIEIGSGKVLSGLTRRIARDMTSLNVGSPADVETVLAAIS
jgi:[acyl-carrier-protein] S-malonyltransferase